MLWLGGGTYHFPYNLFGLIEDCMIPMLPDAELAGDPKSGSNISVFKTMIYKSSPPPSVFNISF